MNKGLNLGSKVRSVTMQEALAAEAIDRLALWSHDTHVVVHHYTDAPDYLQLELEVRYKDGSCKFARIRL